MARTGYKTVFPDQKWGRDASLVLQGVAAGKTNNVFDVTLASSTAVTHLSYPLIGPFSLIGMVPTNTYAATLTPIWADTQTNGAAIVHHGSSSSLVATVRVAVIG